MSKINPTCPTDCDSLVPEVLYDFCGPNYDFGQITKLYVAKQSAASFTDVSDLSEWLARLSDDGTADDDIRTLNVIGSKEAPDSSEIQISLKRTIRTPKKHTVSVKIEETNLTNYEFMRAMDCGGTYKVWYESGKYLYGGTEGIDAQILMHLLIPESTDELKVFEGMIKWEDKYEPEACLNPFA